MGCFAEGVVEGALQGGQLGCIAIFVEQHPGEGDDWIASAGIGIAAGEIVSQVDRGQGLAGVGGIGQAEAAGAIGDGGGLEDAPHIGRFHVANAAFGLQQAGGDALIAFGAHSRGPVHRLANAGPFLPAGAEGGQ